MLLGIHCSKWLTYHLNIPKPNPIESPCQALLVVQLVYLLLWSGRGREQELLQCAPCESCLLAASSWQHPCSLVWCSLEPELPHHWPVHMPICVPRPMGEPPASPKSWHSPELTATYQCCSVTALVVNFFSVEQTLKHLHNWLPTTFFPIEMIQGEVRLF